MGYHGNGYNTSGKLLGACTCNISANLHMLGSHLPSLLQGQACIGPAQCKPVLATDLVDGSCNYNMVLPDFCTASDIKAWGDKPGNEAMHLASTFSDHLACRIIKILVENCRFKSSVYFSQEYLYIRL